MILYTDALVEAMDPAGAMLGEAGLLGLLEGVDPAPAEVLGPAARRRRRLPQGRPAEDDTTLLVLTTTAAVAADVVGEKLDVTPRCSVKRSEGRQGPLQGSRRS